MPATLFFFLIDGPKQNVITFFSKAAMVCMSKRAHRYTIGCKFCDLCATEKTCIALGDPKYMLNKRTEIYRKCDYMKRYKLEALLTDPP